MSGIIHDLRGGLGIIKNIAAFIEDDNEGNQALKKDIIKINRSVDFCELVLQNMKLFSDTNIRRFSNVLITKAVEDVFLLLERKMIDVNLTTDIYPKETSIYGDEGQIRQLFMNLIKNAGEAMPEGGVINVKSRIKNEFINITVSDTGIGISENRLNDIFDIRFTTKEKGWGIGLYIVQNIVEQLGGNIKVKSKLGVGTKFEIQIPVNKDAEND
ncbi:MAG: HAMP domain-containing histidine kinase [Bdellovibrionales bacterium]|nr:HAMP domain-containing histidine kinase [Bdellovibrionales bacterium]